MEHSARSRRIVGLSLILAGLALLVSLLERRGLGLPIVRRKYQ